MAKKLELKIILIMSLIGILFSGFLSYTELFRGICSFGGCSYVLKAPACVYGFFMYLVIFIITCIGLRKNKI